MSFVLPNNHKSPNKKVGRSRKKKERDPPVPKQKAGAHRGYETSVPELSTTPIVTTGYETEDSSKYFIDNFDNTSSLSVHDIYWSSMGPPTWREPVDSEELESIPVVRNYDRSEQPKPKGFLQFVSGSDEAIEDPFSGNGKPRGFLDYVNSFSDPRTKIVAKSAPTIDPPPRKSSSIVHRSPPRKCGQVAKQLSSSTNGMVQDLKKPLRVEGSLDKKSPRDWNKLTKSKTMVHGEVEAEIILRPDIGVYAELQKFKRTSQQTKARRHKSLETPSRDSLTDAIPVDGKPKGFMSFVDQEEWKNILAKAPAKIPRKRSLKDERILTENSSIEHSSGKLTFPKGNTPETQRKNPYGPAQAASSPRKARSHPLFSEGNALIPLGSAYDSGYTSEFRKPIAQQIPSIVPPEPSLQVRSQPSSPTYQLAASPPEISSPRFYNQSDSPYSLSDSLSDLNSSKAAKNTYDDATYPSAVPFLMQSAQLDCTILPNISSFTGHCDWNAEFQNLLETLFDSEESVHKMRTLCENFARVAKEIGTIIISELFVPQEQRKIPSVTDTVGGAAGGEKYVYLPERIFFKFAVDERGLYGGTEYIMKVC
jgi:hypothetical protein